MASQRRKQQANQENYDPELEELMQQVIQGRKAEKDYQSLEDQIRCLKLRKFWKDESQQNQEVANADEDKMIRIQRQQLEEELAGLRRQQEGLKGQYEGQKNNYISLNNYEGEVHAQLADLRGNTSYQLTNNKGVERQILAHQQENERLRDQINEVEGDTRRLNAQTEKLDEKQKRADAEARATREQQAANEREQNRQRAAIDQAEKDISQRRELLNQTQKSFTDLNMVVTEMKHNNDQLRSLFWEQEKKIEYLRRDLKEAQNTKRQKEKDRDILAEERNELESQLKIRQMELGVEKENETAILKHACDLKERLKELNAEIKLLEEQQRKLNEQLAKYAEEDEIIRQELLVRDRAAERLTNENRKVIQQSDAHLRAASASPRRSPPPRQPQTQQMMTQSSVRTTQYVDYSSRKSNNGQCPQKCVYEY